MSTKIPSRLPSRAPIDGNTEALRSALALIGPRYTLSNCDPLPTNWAELLIEGLFTNEIDINRAQEMRDAFVWAAQIRKLHITSAAACRPFDEYIRELHHRSTHRPKASRRGNMGIFQGLIGNIIGAIAIIIAEVIALFSAGLWASGYRLTCDHNFPFCYPVLPTPTLIVTTAMLPELATSTQILSTEITAPPGETWIQTATPSLTEEPTGAIIESSNPTQLPTRIPSVIPPAPPVNTPVLPSPIPPPLVATKSPPTREHIPTIVHTPTNIPSATPTGTSETPSPTFTSAPTNMETYTPSPSATSTDTPTATCTSTPTLPPPTDAATPTEEATLPPTLTEEITSLPTSTEEPTLPPTLTEQPTATPSDRCPGYAQRIEDSFGVSEEEVENALCEPDNKVTTIGGVADAYLILDMGNTLITDHPGSADFVYFEWLTTKGEREDGRPGIYLDEVVIELAEDDGNGMPGQFFEVYRWDKGGNSWRDAEDLFEDHGIAIDIASIGEQSAGPWRFVRLSVPDGKVKLPDNQIQVDGIKTLEQDTVPVGQTATPAPDTLWKAAFSNPLNAVAFSALLIAGALFPGIYVIRLSAHMVIDAPVIRELYRLTKLQQGRKQPNATTHTNGSL